MVEPGANQYTLDEVSQHTTSESCWLVIGNASNGGPKVYDVTKYLDDHPGGAEVMLDVAGQDADEFFEDIGHSKEAREQLKKLYIGDFKLDAATLAKLQAEREAAAAKKRRGGGTLASPATWVVVILVALLAIWFGFLNPKK